MEVKDVKEVEEKKEPSMGRCYAAFSFTSFTSFTFSTSLQVRRWMHDLNERAAERLVMIERVAEIAFDHAGGRGGGSAGRVERLARGRTQRISLPDEMRGAIGADGLALLLELGEAAARAPEKAGWSGELGSGNHGCTRMRKNESEKKEVEEVKEVEEKKKTSASRGCAVISCTSFSSFTSPTSTTWRG
jgi:hypothetical protein